MKVLVTGGNGFIGSHLVSSLLSRGHAVRCLVRRTSNLRWLETAEVEYVYGSLSDPPLLFNATDGVQLVFHLAGQTKGMHQRDYFRINTEGTKNLLDACSQATPGPPKFIFASSLAAAGPSSSAQPKSEKDESTPISTYGKSKLEAEKLVHSYMKSAPAVILRPPAVYGPRDSDVLQFFRWLNRGICPVLGYRKRLVSVIHVSDLINGFLLAAEHRIAEGNTYFICNDEPVQWSAIGDITSKLLKKRVLKIHVPDFILPVVATLSEFGSRISHKPTLINYDKARDMRQLFWICDNTKAKGELGFTPRISLEVGVEETLTWYKKQGWLH